MSSEPSIAPSEATLTASGIARLANVGRAAVSNWRRRYADFPAPVGGSPTSPSFDAHEVEQWLRRHGRTQHADAARWAWRHIESHQPAAQISDVLGVAGALLLVRADQGNAAGDAAGDGLPTPDQLVGHLRDLDPGLAGLIADLVPGQWTASLDALLRAVDQLGSEQGAESAFEHLHNQYATSAHSMSGLAGTPDVVAEVMLTLAGTGPRTFDFTSGTGSILRMAADRALRAGAPTSCHAQEINPQYAVITLLRLWFVHLRARRSGHQPPAPVVHIGDSLLADALPELRAEVVVANFPFGIHDWGHDRLAYDPRWAYGLPPRTEPELAWVQHALAHLSADGTAVVLMPPAAASRPAGRRIRAELIRHGALRAVVALPAGLMPPVGVGLHIWVLTQPGSRQPHAGELLMVDTTAAPEGCSPVETVEAAWSAYRSARYTELPGVHRTVPAIDLLDDQVDLTPQRHLPQAGAFAGDPAEIIARIDDFDQLVARVRRSLPAVRDTPHTPLREAPQADVTDLIRSGSVTVTRAPSRGRTGDATTGATLSTTTGATGSTTGATASTTAGAAVLTTADVVSGGPATGSTTRAADDEPAPRVRAGDILVPLVGRRINARVATPEQVGAELGPGVQLIRVDPARFDPWFVAGVLSRTDNLRIAGRASSSATGALRIDIRRLSIPVLPLRQQQAYGEAFRQLVEFRHVLEQAATTGAALARDIGDGLTEGALGLPDHHG
ncbi:N-6 DNA methylase [Micromonospora sp. WMMD882]|uniref:N-6 DNA methylase n=1 Tax=Micromonospora sp. WMMD882 TaxID=3015151 RepID=UPI00248BF43B|nr:N-6 DNA methylase [Micromonospora sp. WMMD882]WBB79287.1 N-6 DNA methylase [Micromonospora sp. WMMD882]